MTRRLVTRLTRRTKTPALLALYCCLATAVGEQAKGPLEDLPPNISILTHFGERAVWSPQGDRIAFVHRTLGDAFEVELATGAMRCLTCAYSHPGYFRVHYLPSGDYVLIGPEQVTDRGKARWNESELWLLRMDRSGPPIRLNQKLNEGIAVSRISPRIAWSESSNQYPDRIPSGVSRLMVAEVEIDGGGPPDRAGGGSRLPRPPALGDGRNRPCRCRFAAPVGVWRRPRNWCPAPEGNPQSCGFQRETGVRHPFCEVKLAFLVLDRNGNGLIDNGCRKAAFRECSAAGHRLPHGILSS